MKVRISNNSIRFRLKQPEVNRLAMDGKITELLDIGPGPDDRLGFSLEAADAAAISISFNTNNAIIHIPAEKLMEWANTELVGMDTELSNGKGKKLHVLIEKDFMCMDGRDEENEGSYPNPKAAENSN